jgi:beta-glucosidase
VESQVIRPVKELKGFEKVALEPGEEKIVKFTLGKRAFAYYNEQLKDWYVESGTFEILVGKSSAVIECREEVVVKSTTVIRKEFHRNSNLSEVLATPVGKELLKQMGMGQNSDAASDQGNPQMIMEMMKIMPLRSLVTLSSGKFTEEALATLIDQLNQLQSV